MESRQSEGMAISNGAFQMAAPNARHNLYIAFCPPATPIGRADGGENTVIEEGGEQEEIFHRVCDPINEDIDDQD